MPRDRMILGLTGFAKPSRALFVAGLLAGTALGLSQAAAQQVGGGGLSAPLGFDFLGGNLRDQIGESSTGIRDRTDVPRSGIFVEPSIGIEEYFTDNVTDGSKQRRADAVTVLDPTLALTADTKRFTGAFFYSPRVELHGTQGEFDYFSQNFNGYGKLAVLPNFAIGFRAFGNVSSLQGDLAADQNGSTGRNKNNLSQNYSFSVSPSFDQRIGNAGTLSAGYNLSYTLQQAYDSGYGSQLGTLPNLGSSGIAQIYGRPSQNLISNEEYLSFATSPNLGRINDTVRLDGQQNSGGGILEGSYNYTFNNSMSYAFTRFLSVTGSAGYEDIFYGQSGPSGYNSQGGYVGAGQGVSASNQSNQLHISDVTWSAGIKLTPSPDGYIFLGYGHHGGFNAPAVNASYQLTRRTRLLANYSETLGTDAQNLQQNALDTTVNAAGNSVSLDNDLPVLLGGSFFGNQDTVYHLRNLSLSTATTLNRDSASISLNLQQRIARASLQPNTPHEIFDENISLSWDHQINDKDDGIAYINYGIQSLSGGYGSTGEFSFSLTGRHHFNDDLYGYATYNLSNFNNNLNTGNGNGSRSNSFQNMFLIGIRKNLY